MHETLFTVAVTLGLGALVIGAAALRGRYGALPLFLVAAVLQMLAWGMRLVWSQQTVADLAPGGVWAFDLPAMWGLFFTGVLAVGLVVYVLMGTPEFRRLLAMLLAISMFIVALQVAVAWRGVPSLGNPEMQRFWSLITDPYQLPVPTMMMGVNLVMLAIGYQFFSNMPNTPPLPARIFLSLLTPLAFNMAVYGMMWLAGHREYRVLVGGLPAGHAVAAFVLSVALWPYMRYGLARLGPDTDERGVFDVFNYEARLRRTSRELRAARSRYARLFESVREMIFFADSEGRFTECNGAAVDLLGADTPALVGRDLFETLCGDSGLAEELRLALQDRCQVFDMPIAITRPDGQRREALLSCHRLSSRDDPPLGYEGLAKDITDLVETQRNLEHANRALVEAGRDLDDFLHLTDHHMRHSLAAIHIYNDMIQERIDVEQGDLFHYAERIKSNIRRMEEQVESLVTISRVGRSGHPQRPVSLAQTVREVAADLMEHYAERDPMVDWPGDDEDLTASFVPVELHQLLWNLLDNAILYSRPKAPPTVRVTWERAEDEIVVKIADNGQGISPETLERLFAPGMTHLEEASRRGAGMGLKICEKIVTRHGGRLWAESEVDSGSTFAFTIPCPPENETDPHGEGRADEEAEEADETDKPDDATVSAREGP